MRTQYDAEAGYVGINEVQVATSIGFPQQLCKSGNCANGIYSQALGDVISLSGSIYSWVSTGFVIKVGPLSPERCRAVGASALSFTDSIVVYRTHLAFSGTVRRSSAMAGAGNPPDLFKSYCIGTANELDIFMDNSRY